MVETEPVTKGQTAASSYKPAMLSNGMRTNVPPHIVTGTRIVVSTEDGSYVERAEGLTPDAQATGPIVRRHRAEGCIALRRAAFAGPRRRRVR